MARLLLSEAQNFLHLIHVCLARAALRAHGSIFAWQVRRFDSPGIAGARLGAAGARLFRGKRSTSSRWMYFRVAGAAL